MKIPADRERTRRPELMARLAEGARRTAAKFSLEKQLNYYRDLLRDIELERDTGYRRGLGGDNCA